MRKITEVFAAIGGAIASFFVGLPPIMWVLVAVMSIDYVTGIMCGFMGVSPKTPTGGLASGAAFKGLLKKAVIILVVLLAALLDKAVSLGAGITFEAVTGATILWFIASEGFSILENVVALGVPVPKILLQALEIMRTKGDGTTAAQNKTPTAEAAGENQTDEDEKPPAEE